MSDDEKSELRSIIEETLLNVQRIHSEVAIVESRLREHIARLFSEDDQ